MKSVVSHLLPLILFGGVFITSERFMNAENDAKAYFMGIAVLLVLIPCLASRKGIPHLKESLCSHSIDIGVSAVCLILSIYGILQYAGKVPSRHFAFPITGTYENPAGFAAVQATMFPFVYSLCLDEGRSGIIRSLAIITSLVCVLTVALSGSRTGILAVCASAAVVTTFSTGLTSFFKTHRWIWIPLTAVIIGLSLLMYSMKAESANGRLFIWDRCLELISGRPLFGYGTNGFSKCYMDAQAAYFSAHPDSPYVMLADNITHPFNEYLLLTVNYGLVGLLVALSLLAFLIVRLLGTDNRTKVTGFAVLASVFVMCQFSYPFHYAAVWYLVVLAVIPAFTGQDTEKEYVTPRYVRITIPVLLTVLLAVILRMAYLDMKWAEMSKRSLAGHTERMLPYYEEMKPKMKYNALFLYNYAAELNYIGRYEESLAVAEECRQGWNDYDVQMLLADNLENTGCNDMAIETYRHALDMIPCRFEPMNSMMTLYLGNGDTLNALKVANKIIDKPVKVQSYRVEQITQAARDLIADCQGKQM